MRNVKGLFLAMVICLAATIVWAGDIDDPGGPTDANSAMYTITDVYNRINDGTAGTKRTTTFGEPASAPGSTAHTLTDLYDLASERSRPAKTGQTTSYATGDDGDLQKGVSWPNPRFTDNEDGTVTDNLTGLMWLKNANNAGSKNWADALTYCNNLNDSAGYSDWRLPTIREIHSLVDYNQASPAVPSGHPFANVQSNNYWSSTTFSSNSAYAIYVYLPTGDISIADKSGNNYVWPVRGGQ